MTRNSPRKRGRLLEESWAIEDHDEQDSARQSEIEHEKSQRAPERPVVVKEAARPSDQKRQDQSLEPELIMPSMHAESIDGSWVATSPPRSKVKSRRRKLRADGESPSRALTPEETTEIETPTEDEQTAGRVKHKKQQKKKSSSQGESAFDVYRRSGTHGLASAWYVTGQLGRVVCSKVVWIACFLIHIVIVLGLLYWLLSTMAGRILSSLSAPLSTLCSFPGVTSLQLPVCQQWMGAGRGKTPIEFDQMMNMQAKFEGLLESSAVSLDLPLDVKRGEASMRDLRQQVQFSALPSK